MIRVDDDIAERHLATHISRVLGLYGVNRPFVEK